MQNLDKIIFSVILLVIFYFMKNNIDTFSGRTKKTPTPSKPNIKLDNILKIQQVNSILDINGNQCPPNYGLATDTNDAAKKYCIACPDGTSNMSSGGIVSGQCYDMNNFSTTPKENTYSLNLPIYSANM
jgi:hypothetical protein